MSKTGMTLRELKQFAATESKQRIFNIAMFYSDESGSSGGNARQKNTLQNKASRLLKYAESRFGKGWWK